MAQQSAPSTLVPTPAMMPNKGQPASKAAYERPMRDSFSVPVRTFSSLDATTPAVGGAAEASASNRSSGGRPTSDKKPKPAPVEFDINNHSFRVVVPAHSSLSKDKRSASVIFNKVTYHVAATTDPGYFFTPRLPDIVFDLSASVNKPAPEPEPVKTIKSTPVTNPKNANKKRR